jgi:hypothetical protein
MWKIRYLATTLPICCTKAWCYKKQRREFRWYKDCRASIPKSISITRELSHSEYLQTRAVNCATCFGVPGRRVWIRTISLKCFLRNNFQGSCISGCSSWTTSRQGSPYITLTQQFDTGSSQILCSFEAFANQGTPCPEPIDWFLVDHVLAEGLSRLSWAELCIRI